ncbi:MAG: sugar kinase [Fimbriimonas sp.]
MSGIDKVVLVTRKTPLEELVERFNTVAQARFYLERTGTPFAEIQAQHDRYQRGLDDLKKGVPDGVRFQIVDREFLPTFSFGTHNMVLTLGPDGLVVNVAKYLQSQPILAFNPDPQHIDGILLPFVPWQGNRTIRSALEGKSTLRRLAMARVALNDGQELHALNDLFIGARTHVSARYRLSVGESGEDQSSSGVIVSTGAGSTGWYRSLVTGAVGLANGESSVEESRYRWDPESPELRFTVREPFVSRASSANLVHGTLGPGEALQIASQMPQNGVIFSDGVEEDFLTFNSGAIATVSVADRRVHLISRVA